MVLYKDREILQRRNDNDYQKSLKEIADFLREYKSDKEYLRKKLLNGIIEKREHKANHKKCDRKATDSDRITEKRICRCMHYYKNNPEKCSSCTQPKKWNNVGTISISDYEFPTDHVIPKVGGMDLIFDNEYACEVKPEKSKETITRMFAEILTYTQDCKKGYKPAICIFPGSKQMEDYKKFKNNPDFNYINRIIKIFFFNILNERKGIIDFEIKPIELFEG